MPKQSRFSFRCGWFRGARKLWNCLALHWVVDDSQRTVKFTLAIPRLVTMVIQTPTIPRWMGSHVLSGGLGERAEYGLWHDYYETKLQWRRIINLGGKRGGKEWRATHMHGQPTITKFDTIITALVADEPIVKDWVESNRIDRWWFVVSVWRAKSSQFWIPSLYDHFFTLHAQQVGGTLKEVSIKQNISRWLMPIQVFQTLTEQLQF